MKDRLIALYSMISKNVSLGKNTHPLVYCVELQDIIDDFTANNNYQEYELQIMMIQELLNRMKDHIKYNATNFDAYYCRELKEIITSIAG